MITAGANHAFATALTTLVSPGDEVVLPAPYFTNHHMQVRASAPSPSKRRSPISEPTA